jgi:predicted membrane-bound mannosyltransferase
MVARLVRRQDLLPLAAITGVAALVRFATLDAQSFDHDEAVTAARVLQPGLPETLSAVVHSERSPPVYYVLAWGWSKLLGTGEVGLRSLSALIGTLTVPIACAAAFELTSRRRIALVCSALVALNPYLVWYSQEARAYALMALFVALSLVFFSRCLHRPSARSAVWWTVAAALAVGTHYFAVFVVAPQAVWLLAFGRDRRPAAIAVAAVAAAGLALIPLAVAQEGSGRRNGFEGVPLVSRVGESGLNFVASEEPAPFAGTSGIDAVQALAAAGGAVLLAAAVALVATRGSPRERSAAICAGAIAAVGIAVPVALALGGLDFLNPRNVIGALVPLLIGLAVGFGCRGAGRLGLIAAAFACVLFVVVLVAVGAATQMQRPSWRSAAVALGSVRGERVLVVPRNGNDPMALYLDVEISRDLGRRMRIGRIDVLSTTYRVTPPAGFELTDQERMAPFFVRWRFEAKRRRWISLRELAGRRVLGERSAILVGN